MKTSKVRQFLTAGLAISTMVAGTVGYLDYKPYDAGAVGYLDYKPYDAGAPPKLYGQYLQRIGKQKWNRSKK